MSLKSLSAKIPSLKRTPESQIRHQLTNTICQLYNQGHNVETPQDLIQYIDTNHIDPKTLNLSYDYITLKKDILSGKYNVENILPDFNHQALVHKNANTGYQQDKIMACCIACYLHPEFKDYYQSIQSVDLSPETILDMQLPEEPFFDYHPEIKHDRTAALAFYEEQFNTETPNFDNDFDYP